MKKPYIAIVMNDKDGITFNHVKDSNIEDVKRRPLEVDVDFDDLESRGFEGACRSVGEVVIRLFALWYPVEFARHPFLCPPPDETIGESDEEVAAILIEKSMTEKTRSYVSAIDHLLNKPLPANTVRLSNPRLDTWPDLKRQLEKYPE